MHFRLRIVIFVLFVAQTLAAGQAAGAKLKGVVIANEEGGPPLGNITLSAGDDANPTVSDSVKGTFTFMFPKKKVGDSVHLYVKAEGYVVVNDFQLPVNLPFDPDSNPVTIIVCKKAIQEEMRSKFYRVKSDQTLDTLLAQRIRDLENAHMADAATIERLKKELDQTKALAAEGAHELAKQDIETASELYRQAMRSFLTGKIEESIRLLDENKLNRQLKAANELEATAKATKRQVTQEWLLKARLLTLQFRFFEADHAYKTAIDASPDDIEAARAYAFFKRNNETVEAQTATVFKCPKPCGPHGPYPDVPLEGVPEDLPSARALTGSSRVLATQLSDLIDEGHSLVRQFLGTDDTDFLSKNEITWQATVEQLLSPYLDPRLVKALSQVNSKQFSTMNNHNQKGIVICNLVKAKTDLLTMFYNQLIGVGD
jgi:tetratricopeptide (TPR) repeat protein